MTDTPKMTIGELDALVDDPEDFSLPVAFVLCERLKTVEEGTPSIVFPPTYAIADQYVIDTLPDGTKTVLIDSVGSQANRMEPLFARPPLADFVPQILIRYGEAEEDVVSIFEVGHRLGDALIRASDMAEEAQNAFRALLNHNDAEPLARLAPTSLVFGVWDSRDTGAKVPRIVQSLIRAWDVVKLRRSAQYNPPIDYSALNVFSEEERKKHENNPKSGVARGGFVHVPAGETHGGVAVFGQIERQATLNLVALRRLNALDESTGRKLRRYILGLALAGITEPMDPFLRQGCLLVPDPNDVAVWQIVERDGRRRDVGIDRNLAREYLHHAADEFGVRAEVREVVFDRGRAKELVKQAMREKS